MTSLSDVSTSNSPWMAGVTRAMEFLWLLTVFLVPLVFVGPGLMDSGFDVPKVTLYRSLVGLMGALWIIESGLTRPVFGAGISRLSPSHLRGWLLAQPGRWVLVAALMLQASYLISTLLSPSIPVSLWGREPALDSNSLYITLSHFLFFLVVATHLKKSAQFWRLLSAITSSGLAVGLYAVLQYYGLDPFGIHVAGAGVTSSLANPIFAGAFLLMAVSVTLALAFKFDGTSASPARTIFWVIPLTILVLGMAFTQSRGPWVGLAAGLAVFLALLGLAMGWRASLRALSMSATAIVVTWTVVTIIPPPSGGAGLAPRVLSVGTDVVSALAAELTDSQSQENSPSNALRSTTLTTPTSMQTRLFLWKNSAEMALHRPWFQPEDRPHPFPSNCSAMDPNSSNTFFR